MAMALVKQASAVQGVGNLISRQASDVGTKNFALWGPPGCAKRLARPHIQWEIQWVLFGCANPESYLEYQP